MAEKGIQAAIKGAARAGGNSSAAASNLAKRQIVGNSAAEQPTAEGEAVTGMMRWLNLTPKEAAPLILDDEGDDDLPCPKWALVGKVLAPNTLHVNTIAAVVRPAWGNPKGLKVKPMGDNLFMADFATETDKLRIEKGGPWHLSKHAILLTDFDVRVRPENFVFNKLSVWARIMNLGYELMNKERGTALASRLGVVDHVDVDDEGRAWGSFLRVRVTVDPTQPIMRYASVYSKKRDVTDHYAVMYEGLPVFCFSCGLIGHSSVVCPTPADRDADGKLPYNGDKICVPEKKKKDGSSADRPQSNKHSWNGNDQGSGSQGPFPAGKKKAGDGHGEVISPLKKKTRARRTAPSKKRVQITTTSTVEVPAASQNKEVGTGRKRKQQKQVYVAKIPTLDTATGEGTLVLMGDLLNPEVSSVSVADKEGSDDSNKKQKTASSGSADQAAAVEQPRQTQ
ncbi:hypothetical protein QYE76_070900 [Lolium multiflorum]|uniref:DUF4283 domain-containing protein n=1 Tax=Lolium multiflorum TaxID=4521 RepID=A0AAD8SIR9_LOLMU|nr:hypothetical protein QYE76_070900 [Lolium multiflorum]